MSCLPSRCSDVKPAVGFIQAGAGETVILLLGSASSSLMWRAAMLGVVHKVALDWQASSSFDPGADRLKLFANRTAVMRGDLSPEPMFRLVEALHTLMPGSVRNVVHGTNHLLPLTHPAEMTKLILEHLHTDAERRLH